jgi:fatty acid desaturase
MKPLAGYRGTGPPATPERWLRRALLDWVIIILCFRAAHWSLFETTSLMMRVATLVPLVVVIAARQHALGILAHDGAHRLICRNRFLNDFLANLLCEWPLMSNLGGYRAFHFEHHRKVGTPEDPELIHKNNQWRILNIPVLGQWPVPIHPWKFALFIAGDFVGAAFPHLLMAARLTRPRARIDMMGQMCFLGTAVTLLVWLEAIWILVLWFVSLGTVFWTIFRIRIWTEHVGTEGTHVLRPTALQKFIFLPHNTWCHYEHHEHPSVPCWVLPDIRDPNMPTVTMRELFASFLVGNAHGRDHSERSRRVQEGLV